MSLLKKALPFAVLAVVLLVIAAQYGRTMKPAGAPDGHDFDALAKTVVMDDGRAKPLDAAARNALLVIYNKQRFKHQGETVDAIVWLMDVIARPEVARAYKTFRIDHPDVIELMGLRPEDGDDDKHFSYAQLESGRPALFELIERIRQKEKLTLYETKARDLFVKIQLYDNLSNGSRPLVIPPDPDVEGSVWLDFGRLPIAMGTANRGTDLENTASMYVVARVVHDRALRPEEIEPKIKEMVQRGQLPQNLLPFAQLYSDYRRGGEAWDIAVARMAMQFGPGQEALIRERMTGFFDALSKETGPWPYFDLTGVKPGYERASTWFDVVHAYRNQDPRAFNTALSARDTLLAGQGIDATQKAGFEVFFNRFMPFVQAEASMVMGFLLAMGVMYFGRSEKGSWGRAVWQGMMGSLGAGLVLFTFGLLARMYITGRPPVTDLYSSAVLVGWACVGVCLLIEWITKRGFGGIVAAVTGFATLIIAHHLQLQKGEDTMGPMRAVLDSNFWLATHVIVVTLGYAATFVAGLLALVYIIKGMATPRLSRPEARQLTQMVYGTVCFALLLSFVGTVLGGIWADQSWGRFWGWDPKENGAVMIVMMNAIILHAKWGKLVKERGIMVLAVGGNIITAWSWFGTNQLGVGLHAYGFTDGTVQALTLFVASQLLIMSAAMLVPTRYWWSFNTKRKPDSDLDEAGQAAGKHLPLST